MPYMHVIRLRQELTQLVPRSRLVAGPGPPRQNGTWWTALAGCRPLHYLNCTVSQKPWLEPVGPLVRHLGPGWKAG